MATKNLQPRSAESEALSLSERGGIHTEDAHARGNVEDAGLAWVGYETTAQVQRRRDRIDPA